MSINKKCPKCNSNKVQLSTERSKKGCLWTILFGFYYIFYVIFVKWMIGLMIFIMYDIWAAIIRKIIGKKHIWQSKKWFSGKVRTFYCHDCGYNFKD